MIDYDHNSSGLAECMYFLIAAYSFVHVIAYATRRNNTEVYRSYFIHSVKQVKLQYQKKNNQVLVM